jgi:glycine cleavage system H lipoate-binding protein
VIEGGKVGVIDIVIVGVTEYAGVQLGEIVTV